MLQDRQRQVDHYKCEGGLIGIVNFRPVRTTSQDPASKEQRGWVLS